jgi:hypothetical protein
VSAFAVQGLKASDPDDTMFLEVAAASEGKTDELISLMKQFIAKYPKDDKVWFAYDSIAQNAINAGKTDEGLAAYREFAEKYAESPQAGEALYKIAEVQRTQAAAIGRYGALNEQERSQWKTLMDGSIASSEELIKKFPDSPSLALALQTLLQSQRMMERARHVLLQGRCQMQFENGRAFMGAVMDFGSRHGYGASTDRKFFEQGNKPVGTLEFTCRRVPQQGFHRQGAQVGRVHAIAPEGFEQGNAVAVRIVDPGIMVCGDHGAQEFTEADVIDRHVVERTHADFLHVRSGLAEHGGKAIYQMGMQRAVAQHAAAAGREAYFRFHLALCHR